jgi:serine/threonine protein kinase
MEKLDINLFDILKKNDGKLTKKQQEEIIELFEKLDKIKIFHKDPNPLNFMYDSNKNMKIIDFGFAEMIEENPKIINPNIEFMILGFLIKLKKLFPNTVYKHLYKKLNKEQQEILSI